MSASLESGLSNTRCLLVRQPDQHSPNYHLLQHQPKPSHGFDTQVKLLSISHGVLPEPNTRQKPLVLLITHGNHTSIAETPHPKQTPTHPMSAAMPDLSRLSRTIKATPEWAQLLICITVFTLCTFLGWNVFARASSSTVEPVGGDPPRYVETEKAAANGTYDEKVDSTQTVVKPVEEKPLDGGEKVNGGNFVVNEADEGDGLEEVVVVAMPQGVKGKRTRRRG